LNKHRSLPRHQEVEVLERHMIILRNFIDELYAKTVFRNGRIGEQEPTPGTIKFLFAFENSDGQYPIGILGRRARIKRSTITDLADRMEHEGLAERVRSGHDRRVVAVRLTEKGRKMREIFSGQRKREIQSLFARLHPDEIERLIACLAEATAILKRAQ